MVMEKHLRKIQKRFYDYDFTDSIIETLKFDNTLMNFSMFVDYYFTEKDEEYIQLTFEKCTKVSYEIPKNIYILNKGDLNISHFTISKTTVLEVDNQICVKIFTFNNEREFLKLLCSDVKFESISKSN